MSDRHEETETRADRIMLAGAHREERVLYERRAAAGAPPATPQPERPRPLSERIESARRIAAWLLDALRRRATHAPDGCVRLTHEQDAADCSHLVSLLEPDPEPVPGERDYMREALEIAAGAPIPVERGHVVEVLADAARVRAALRDLLGKVEPA